MVKDEWGVKRTCQGCSARFYDLLKSPILCPKCGATFEIQTSGRGRRNRISSDISKEAALNNNLLVEDIDLIDGGDSVLPGDSELMEDTSDLDGDLDDIPDVLDHESDNDEL